jgi:hypothetical protein
MPPVPPEQGSPYGDCATADIAGRREADRRSSRVEVEQDATDEAPPAPRASKQPGAAPRPPLIPQHAPQPPPDLDAVCSFRVWCRRIGVSEATGRRLLASGKGPRITWLSTRRMGVRERHHVEWLDARAASNVLDST